MKAHAHRTRSTKGGEPMARAIQSRDAPVHAHPEPGWERQILESPRLVAQRARIDATFGAAIQREGLQDENELQMKALPGALQRMGMEEEEEPLQGRFGSDPVQARLDDEEEPLQGRFLSDPVQGQFHDEEEEPLQARAVRAGAPPANPSFRAPDRTGLPDALKAGIESLSGHSMDHVRVHYDSPQPAQVQAHAFAQGSHIHLGPGQERHLPHEAWHVVQQAQGRVQPTLQAQGVSINDDRGLEQEADVMGARALQMRSPAGEVGAAPPRNAGPVQRAVHDGVTPGVLQAVWVRSAKGVVSWMEEGAPPGFEATAEEHGPHDEHPKGPVYAARDSAILLAKLSIPQVRPGPSVDVQKRLVAEMDKVESLQGGLVNLGGILLDDIPAKDGDLLANARLVAPPMSGGFVSAGFPRARDLIEAGLDGDVVENTLRTMIDSGEIAYLRSAGLPNAAWKIYVEVHFFRERDMSVTGFHKDTLGETLFVNLNYHMDRTVVAPEFVVNPAPSQTHDDQIAHTLPGRFREDLAFTRRELGAPTGYGTDIAKPYDYVAFVDEAIHHATPFYHHRYVTGADLRSYLEAVHPAEFKEAEKGYQTYKSSRWPAWTYGFDTYLDAEIIPASDAPRWLWLMERVHNPEVRITREDLGGMLTDTEFDEVLEAAGARGGSRTKGAAPGFHAASIPKTGGTVPINPGRPPLKRQLSNPDFRKTLPPAPPETEKRAFFRTWVRAVPEEKAKLLRKG